MFNKVRTIGKIVKTVASPITQAANVIKTTFTKPKTDQASKYRKKALKMTKEATAKAGESAKAAESRIGKEEAQKIGRETKSKMVKDFLRYNRDLKAKGGRIGFKKGGDLGMQSVKYGLDNNPDITKADPKAKFIAANKKNKKSKKKVI
jgi:uncharacterized protein with gpF-like domain